MEKFFKLSEAIEHFKKGPLFFFASNQLEIDKKKPSQTVLPICSLDDLQFLSSIVLEIEMGNKWILPVILKYTQSDNGLLFFTIENVSYMSSIRNIVTRFTTIEKLLAENNLNNPVRLVKYASDIEEKIAYLEKSKHGSSLNFPEALLEKIPFDRLFTEIENRKTFYVKIIQAEYSQSWLEVRMWLMDNDVYYLYSSNQDELYIATVDYLRNTEERISWYTKRE